MGEGRVVGGESEVILSRREALLLETLARRPRQVFTREKLLDHAFDNAETEGAVDTYVYYLRKKLGKNTIETVHGVGYRLGSVVTTPTVVGRQGDPVRKAARSVALTVGLASLVLVVLVTAAAVWLFDREQWAEIGDRVQAAARTADDTTDAPPGIWLIEIGSTGRAATPGTPQYVLDSPDLRARDRGHRHGWHLGGQLSRLGVGPLGAHLRRGLRRDPAP